MMGLGRFIIWLLSPEDLCPERLSIRLLGMALQIISADDRHTADVKCKDGEDERGAPAVTGACAAPAPTQRQDADKARKNQSSAGHAACASTHLGD